MPGSHPLHVPRPQDPVRAGVVAMLERALEHHRDRLHAAMRMLLEPLRRAEPVFAQEQERRGLSPSPRRRSTSCLLSTCELAPRGMTRATRLTRFSILVV